MQLNIGASIRRLRQERNITQEDLASALGVTPQAVSKWERSDGYPDITLLPEIAAYFEVSLDNLCGLDEERTRSEICRIRRDAIFASSYDEGVRIAREGIAKYPRSWRLKEALASALRGCPGSRTPPKEILDEIIRLYEDIIEHCPDRDLVYRVLAEVWEVYQCAGENDKAVDAARRLPGFYETSDRVLSHILSGRERAEHVQNTLIGILPQLDHMLRSMAETQLYSGEEKIAVYDKMIAMYEIVGDRHDWMVGLIFSVQLYRMQAELYLEIGDDTSCLNALENAARLAEDADLSPEEGYPQSLLISIIPLEALTGERDIRRTLRNEIEENPAFDPIRGSARYCQILAGLTDA